MNFCSKCGKKLKENTDFCLGCGIKVSQKEEKTSKKAKGFKKVLMIIGGIVLGLIIFFVGILAIVFFTSNRLVCRSDEGNVTIMYNDRTLTGYTVRNMRFNLEEQRKYAEYIGIEAYIKEFAEWFENNTSGSCER